jgi:hypothetical protein
MLRLTFIESTNSCKLLSLEESDFVLCFTLASRWVYTAAAVLQFTHILAYRNTDAPRNPSAALELDMLEFCQVLLMFSKHDPSVDNWLSSSQCLLYLADLSGMWSEEAEDDMSFPTATTCRAIHVEGVARLIKVIRCMLLLIETKQLPQFCHESLSHCLRRSCASRALKLQILLKLRTTSCRLRCIQTIRHHRWWKSHRFLLQRRQNPRCTSCPSEQQATLVPTWLNRQNCFNRFRNIAIDWQWAG